MQSMSNFPKNIEVKTKKGFDSFQYKHNASSITNWIGVFYISFRPSIYISMYHCYPLPASQLTLCERRKTALINTERQLGILTPLGGIE